MTSVPSLSGSRQTIAPSYEQSLPHSELPTLSLSSVQQRWLEASKWLKATQLQVCDDVGPTPVCLTGWQRFRWCKDFHLEHYPQQKSSESAIKDWIFLYHFRKLKCSVVNKDIPTTLWLHWKSHNLFTLKSSQCSISKIPIFLIPILRSFAGTDWSLEPRNITKWLVSSLVMLCQAFYCNWLQLLLGCGSLSCFVLSKWNASSWFSAFLTFLFFRVRMVCFSSIERSFDCALVHNHSFQIQIPPLEWTQAF